MIIDNNVDDDDDEHDEEDEDDDDDDEPSVPLEQYRAWLGMFWEFSLELRQADDGNVSGRVYT